MSLVEDYLRAVAALLPKAQRDDITAELRDLILSRIEEKEAGLGRPLTEDEVEAVLHEVGHPLVVAARYREGPQTIVGPALYPFWLFAVKLSLAVQACVIGIVFVVQALAGGDVGRAIGHAFANGITGAATTIGFITVAAWIIERQGKKPEVLEKWRVKDLRFLELAAWDLGDWRAYVGTAGPEAWHAGERRVYAGTPMRRRSQASRGLGMIVGAAVFLLWWVGVLRFGFSAAPEAFRAAGVEPGALVQVDWAGLKQMLFWPVALYTLGGAAYGFVVMARPFAHRVQGALDVALGLSLLVGVWWTAMLSPLSAALGGNTVAALALRVKLGFENGPPFALDAIVILLLGCAALNGISRIARGLWLMVDPHPRWGEPRPA